MAATFSAYSEGAINNTGTTCTVSHTVGSGSNRVLYVLVMNSNSSDLLAAGSCTFNGSSLGSPIATQAGGTSHRIYAWRMTAPPTGTFDVVVTASSTAQLHVHVFSLDEVDQTTPEGTIVSSGNASRTSPVSNSATLSTDGLAVDLCSRRSAGITLTPGGGQTAAATTLNSSGTAASTRASYKAGSGSTSMSWTFSSTSDVIHIVIPVNAASGGDVTAPILSSGTATETGDTTATLGATTDEGNGTLYWVATTSATEPSAAQVKLGNDHADAAAAYADSDAVGSTGAKTNNATGLTASTAYYAYAMHEDAAANQSDVLYLGTFTTTAANAAPSWSGTPSAMSSKRGQAYTPQDITSLVSDADLDTLTYTLTGAPTGVTIHSTTGVISGTPTAAPGVYACTVEADDGTASPVASSSFNITVTQAVLALSGAGYEFGDGNAPATTAAENAVAWEIAVVADELPVTATLYHSASSTTSSTGYLSDIGDDDFVFGTTYVLQARRVSDGEWITFPITAS